MRGVFSCYTIILRPLLSGREGRWSLTKLHQNFVKHVVEGPDIWGPVGMTQAPFEGEEPGQDLWELTLKTRTYCQGLDVQ